MGQSDDVEDSTYNKHQDLCQKLNMDATAASEAWRSYETIRQNYTLEGDQLHWIGCALYVACRNSSTPTVGRAGTNVEGNCVSLTQLLRLCKLSLIQFFTKSKSWADMANMPQDFRAKIDKLERNFAVSSLIFKKYQPIFTDIFKNPGDDVSRPPRSRRSKPVPCTPAKAFEFCWTLFVCIKAAFPDISDDLVNSYHLLLACCDFIYGNALLANRKDLLNPNFPGLPANFTDENYAPPETANCIVSLLCDRHDAIPVEANVIKEYTLKSHINKFFNEKVLRGDQSTFSGILEALNFEGNSKAINKSYEQHVLSVGDFDERIFLAEWRRLRLNGASGSELLGGMIPYRGKILQQELRGADASDNIGSPSKIVNVGDLQEQFQNKREQGGGQMPHSAHPVPTASKKYFRAREITSSTPVSTATQSVVRLQTLLAGRQPAPSESLLDIYNSCSQDVKTLVEAKVKELGERFCASYTQSTSDNETALDFGKKRLILAQTLFYKLLEMILNEEKRKKPNLDHTLLMTSLLTNEIFLQCLFACCLEIVIYSYKNEDRTFPWILKALNVEAYNLYKVIEIIVDAEDQLSRDVVKHLHLTEYKILESLAWQSTSPLWRAIESTEGGVPKCEEVALRGSQDTVDPNAPGQPALRRLALDRGAHHDVPQSPVSSASERFQSPVTASGQVKKRLFPDSRVGGQSVLRVGQSVLSQKAVAVDGNSRILFTVSERNPSSQAASGPSQAAKVEEAKEKCPRRTGSVALFFRKFYNLACSRMQDLCNSLDITDGDLKLKIWTIFEYSIKERTALMKDRHLDQILMCAVYVICKLARMEKHSFTEIMRCYRLQAQAESHIYRSVLISRNEENEAMEVDGNTGSGTSAENSIKHDGATAPPTPSNMAGTSQSYGSEVRGDLIKFYNTVYVPEVKEFANRLGVSKGSVLNLTLSPLPRSKPLTSSPVRRVTKSVMTRTLDPKAISASPAPQLTYCFSRSPAKDLEAINRMMITVDARKNVGKRLLADDTEMEVEAGETSPAKKTMTTSFIGRKLENIIGEQRTQNQ